MAEKKKIACRQCGKLFVPCAYCQSHADVFRWRNFACSIECATKYINDTIAYRESQKNKTKNVKPEKVESKQVIEETSDEKVVTTKKKYSKKSIETNESKIENYETE